MCPIQGIYRSVVDTSQRSSKVVLPVKTGRPFASMPTENVSGRPVRAASIYPLTSLRTTSFARGPSKTAVETNGNRRYSIWVSSAAAVRSRTRPVSISSQRRHILNFSVSTRLRGASKILFKAVQMAAQSWQVPLRKAPLEKETNAVINMFLKCFLDVCFPEREKATF